MIWRFASVRGITGVVERNALVYRRTPMYFVSAVLEPALYLLSIGVGVGTLVGKVRTEHVAYAAYVAPAVLAISVMNAAVNQTSFAVFSRTKDIRGYDAILPTPLTVLDIVIGEIVSAMAVAFVTSVGFIVVMLALGLDASVGLLLAVPGGLLVAFAFAAVGLLVTTFLKDEAAFQLIQLVMLPMFLFATAFYPLTTYPPWLRPLVVILPLYPSIELLREPALEHYSVNIIGASAYLLALGAFSLAVTVRRMTWQLTV